MPSEFELIRRHFGRDAARDARVLLGVGDDAALLEPAAGLALAVSTDMLLEGRHFAPGADARRLGHKALAVNLSDLAAMGATPRWATLALALPRADESWLAAFAEGLYALAARHALALVGGDTTRAAEGCGLAISVTVLGEVPGAHALTRGGARPGDDIWVSGALGGAALGLAHRQGRVALEGEALAQALERLDAPEPRVELGGRLRGLASAAIDVSDGFAADLGHVLERSGVGAMVELARLPRCASLDAVRDAALEAQCLLAGGDDYELVFTAAQGERGAIEALGAELGVALSRVGSIQPAGARVSNAREALLVRDAAGRAVAVPRGFDHFAAAT